MLYKTPNILPIGMDPDFKELKKGKKFKIDLVFAVREYLPFRTNAFDGIFINEVLEHVEDEDRVLNEVWRTLRDKGLLYISAPNKFALFDHHGMHISYTRIPNLLG